MSQGFEIASFVGFYSILGVSLFVAFRTGGRPERLGASILVAMLVLQLCGRLIFTEAQFATLDGFSLASDLIGLIGFTVLGYFANRFWCIWAASFQLLSVSAHFARIADVAVEPLVYALMRSSPTLLAILAMLAGTANYHRRMQRRQATTLPRQFHGSAFSQNREPGVESSN